MRSWIGTVLLLALMLWPAAADLSDIKPIVQYTLPADIMQVDFAHETWVYRLHEDGRVEKLVNRRILAKQKIEDPRAKSPDTDLPV